MTNYLVVTAMGTDRPGLVARLAKLASDCDCDIVDSRMAGFGNEFTIIMMMSGSWPAITQLESQLPQLSVELELLTVMKRTSKHTPQNYASRLEVTLHGLDQRGTLRKITAFLAERSLDLGAVRSFSTDDDANTQHLFLAINIPENVNLEDLEQSIAAEAQALNLSCSIKRMQGVQVPDIS
ncbi:glycine cleavage system transcriptional repressor [Shewanella sp. A3A]|uniref:Glycine cleavage system transcriptional repressor n=1 Tax=Shewanella electrica TaxID=515560 RepID=A0ABT2FL51_9GAMM|nr:ACT domain-containing protein [Shewanella electrica]MCH1921037.1 glycine cleavage system transcriptional repressor [Shewanella ferrihydritica]MCH1923849.1 glycine cleavage system transcriptional repressor [Shewanella electrica]MCS4557068.1 glycine cleavage system transcriptional repressor [Shewanella electrica]